MAGRERFTPYRSEDASLTIPTFRQREENGKQLVEDKKEASILGKKKKKHYPCS